MLRIMCSCLPIAVNVRDDTVGEVAGTAGEVGGTMGKVGGTAGVVGGTMGKVGGTAGVVGGTMGEVGGTAGVVAGTAGVVGGTAGEVGGPAGVVGGTAGVVGGPAGEVGGPADEVQSLSPILPEPETACKVGIILFLREMSQISKINPPFSLRSYLCSSPMDLFQEIVVYEFSGACK